MSEFIEKHPPLPSEHTFSRRQLLVVTTAIGVAAIAAELGVVNRFIYTIRRMITTPDQLAGAIFLQRAHESLKVRNLLVGENGAELRNRPSLANTRNYILDRYEPDTLIPLAVKVFGEGDTDSPNWLAIPFSNGFPPRVGYSYSSLFEEQPPVLI